jgi:biopolymer transport protein ExbD
VNLKPAYRAARGPETLRLNLVALIDVVLFILLYFMLATSFAPEEKHLPTTLGVEGKGAGSSHLAAQTLHVELAEGTPRFRLGERVVQDGRGLVALLNLLPKQGGIMIRVANDVPVESAATALQSARDAGFTKVSYVTPRR